jgi:hypothetical protein
MRTPSVLSLGLWCAAATLAPAAHAAAMAPAPAVIVNADGPCVVGHGMVVTHVQVDELSGERTFLAVAGDAPQVNVVAVVTTDEDSIDDVLPGDLEGALSPVPTMGEARGHAIPAAGEPAEIFAPRSPIDWGRDYGRLLILLAVPAAFLGLHLHLSRRAYIVPPSR